MAWAAAQASGHQVEVASLAEKSLPLVLANLSASFSRVFTVQIPQLFEQSRPVQGRRSAVLLVAWWRNDSKWHEALITGIQVHFDMLSAQYILDCGLAIGPES